jgi:hypothetical protein
VALEDALKRGDSFLNPGTGWRAEDVLLAASKRIELASEFIDPAF